MTDLVACLTAELIGPSGTVRRIARTAAPQKNARALQAGKLK
jgi:hypothetical protein